VQVAGCMWLGADDCAQVTVRRWLGAGGWVKGAWVKGAWAQMAGRSWLGAGSCAQVAGGK